MSATSFAPRAVLFDLDGTLADTAPDLWAVANALRAERGLRPIDYAAFRPFVSRGGRAMLEVALAELDETQRAGLLATFLERYGRASCVHTRLFPGLAELLALLDARAVPWGIVSNKPIALAEPLLAALGLATRCGVLLGGDSLAARKPDPLPLRVACERLGVVAAEAIYLGDDRRDVEAARAAGMPVIAAGWGYLVPGDDPWQWGADRVLDDAACLPSLLGLVETQPA